MTIVRRLLRSVSRHADAASCREVARLVQEFVDGDVDARTAARIERHLEECRKCGLEVHVYLDIKASLRRHRSRMDADAVARLRAFADRVGRGESS